MKHLLFLIPIIGLTLFSCTKSESCGPTPTSLDGKWKMVSVKDNNSGAIITKPSSVQGDVVLNFTTINPTDGTFDGNTPTNSIQPNDYFIGSNQSMNIPNLSMTKVAETTWGNEFVDNIRSSQEYNFETCGRLNIKTINKTLTFEKQ